MAAYESIFIIRPDLDEETVAKTCDRIGALIVDHHGSVVAMEKMGHRHLSYEVKGHNDGYYVVLNYEGEAATTAELERTYKISDQVIRYIIVKRETPFKPALGRESAREAAREEAPEETPGEASKDAAQVPSEAPKDAADAPVEPPKEMADAPVEPPKEIEAPGETAAEAKAEAAPVKTDATPEA